MKRTVKKINPSLRSTFDQQRWPVLVAITVMAGIAMGAILTISSGFWRTAGLISLPVFVGGVVALLCRLDNEQVRRSLQFSIIVSLAAHLLVLIFASITDVFQNPFETPERQVARQQVRTIEISDQRASFVWEETNSRETPEPDVKVVKREQAKSNLRPQTIPLENAKPDPSPQLTKRKPRKSTVPRRQRELSELRRQLEAESLRPNRKLAGKKPTKVETRTAASSKPKSESVKPNENQDRSSEIVKQNQKIETPEETSLSKLLADASRTARVSQQLPKERQRRPSEDNRIKSVISTEPDTNRRSMSRRSRENRVDVEPNLLAAESSSKSTPTKSTTAESAPSANVAADQIAKSRTESRRPEQPLSVERPRSSMRSDREAKVVRRETEIARNASIANALSTETENKRSTKQLAITASPVDFESPAKLPESRDTSRLVKSKTLAITKGSGGAVGSGQSANLDKYIGGKASPARVASNSANRKRTLSKPNASPMLTSSQQSRSRRTTGPALAPTSLIQADTTAVAKLSGLTEASETSLESAAATISARSTDNRDEISAEKGEAAVDFGPIKIVQDRSSRRLSGGGQPEVARLNPNTTRRSRDQSDRQPSLSALKSIEIGAPQRLSSKPSSIPEATVSTLASVAERSGGKAENSARRMAAAESGTPSLPSVRGPSGTALNVSPSSDRRRSESRASSTIASAMDLGGASQNTTRRRARTNRTLIGNETDAVESKIAQTSSSGGKPGGSNSNLAARDVSVGRASLREAENESEANTELAGFKVDVKAEMGPAGLGTRKADVAGVRTRPASEDSRQLMPDLFSRFKRPEFGGPPAINSDAVFAADAFRNRSPKSLRGVADPTTEASIQLGLEWLARNQSLDGSWSLAGFDRDSNLSANGLNSDAAATGLALLAFQGAGYNHREYKYARQLDLAVQWLVDNQTENGDLYVTSDKRSDSACHLYSHGIATLALTEAYGMTQDPRLKEPAQAAIRFIENNQDARKGGWRYFVEKSKRSTDTSVTGWMMMALHSGRMAGLEVDPKTFQGIDDWLLVAASPDTSSQYRYNPYAINTKGVSRVHGKNPTTTMTAVGLLMQIYNGWEPSDPRLLAGAKYLLREQLPDDSTIQLRDTYYWYYATQVIKYVDGDSWKQWNDRLRPLLTRSQIKTGEFAGSWHPYKPVPDRWGRFGGRLYVTALNLMSLEVRHRMLPLYRQKKSKDKILGFIEGGELMIAQDDVFDEPTFTRSFVETSMREASIQQANFIATELLEPVERWENESVPEIEQAEPPSIAVDRNDSGIELESLGSPLFRVTKESIGRPQVVTRQFELSSKALMSSADFAKGSTARAALAFGRPTDSDQLITDSMLNTIPRAQIRLKNNSVAPSAFGDSIELTSISRIDRSKTANALPEIDAATEPKREWLVGPERDSKNVGLAARGTQLRKNFSIVRSRNSLDLSGQFRLPKLEAAVGRLKNSNRKRRLSSLVHQSPINQNVFGVQSSRRRLASAASRFMVKLPKVRQSNPVPEYGEVYGTVTLDGESLSGARVRFKPINGTPGEPIVALTNSVGQYLISAANTRSRKGIFAGRYLVSIYTVVESPDVRTIDLLEIVPKNYNVKSKLEAVVEGGKNRSVNFNLKTVIGDR